MRRAIMYAIFAAAALSASACGTIYNMDGRTHLIDVSRPEQAMRVFGGVRLDVESVVNDYQETFTPKRQLFDHEVGEFITGTCIAAVDLVLSAAGDTLTLPITIAATLSKRNGTEPTTAEARNELRQFQGYWNVVSKETGGSKQSPLSQRASGCFGTKSSALRQLLKEVVTT